MEQFKKREYYEMDYWDLDELIETHLGFNPGCCDCWETGNDTWKVLHISKNVDIYETEELKLLLEDGEQYGYKIRNSYNAPYLAMVELCRRDIIPEGNYLITICW